MFKYLSFAIFILCVLPLNFLAQGSESNWHRNKVNVDYINNRIDNLAVQYKEYAPIPKTAVYDIGYPRNAAEFDELNGYGLLLVAALSQTKEELPVKRVYVSFNGSEIELKRLKMILSQSEDKETQTYKTFGAYRMDAIYAFPVYLRMREAVVLMDFGKDQKPMKMASFNGETPDSLRVLPNRMPTAKGYTESVLEKFMKREYPGFFEN